VGRCSFSGDVSPSDSLRSCAPPPPHLPPICRGIAFLVVVQAPTTAGNAIPLRADEAGSSAALGVLVTISPRRPRYPALWAPGGYGRSSVRATRFGVGSTAVTAGVLAAVLAALTLLAGCAMSDPSADGRAVRPDHPRQSPSGQFTAYAEPGPDQNGVETWTVVVRGRAGEEVFRDDYAYSTRHGVLITWLTTEPHQLWVYSGDVAVSYVSPDSTGRWTKTAVSRDEIPSEITDLWKR